MPLLVAPDVSYHSSWLEGSAEFDGAHRDGGGAEDWPLEELKDAQSFRQFVDALIDDAPAGKPAEAGIRALHVFVDRRG